MSFHSEIYSETHSETPDAYLLSKAPRIKYVKGVCARSGRTVRAAELQGKLVYAQENMKEHGWFHVYSFPNNCRYSDKSKDHRKKNACCGHSHICIHIVNNTMSRYGRSLKISKKDLDFAME